MISDDRLTAAEWRRYGRQTCLPEIGEKGQEAWKRARVLIVGVGGLGSVSARYLCAAGVGHLRLVDPDVVSESNLQRQVMYEQAEIGRSKAECAAARLRALNPYADIEAHAVAFNRGNALALAEGCDLIMDGTDGKAVRYLLDSVSVGLGIPYVYAAIADFQGRVAVWNTSPDAPVYRDLFPEDETPLVQPAPPGVIGPLPGVAAAWQTWEALACLCGARRRAAGDLLCFDLLGGAQYRVQVPADPKRRAEAEADFARLKAGL
ncbi:MAG: HesA/MoeB/ThiF family protein [Bacteroidales bacterium]|nr:HesA/MoeB/ThiF family protein [Bacteroidales bacterium]